MKYYPPRYLFRRYEVIRRVKAGDLFLEIGPGNIDLAVELLVKFSKGILVDFNSDEVQRIYDELKESYKQRLKLIIADFFHYGQFDLKFDCIVACEVLEHIEDDRSFLEKTNSLLADQGQLILSVPARKKYWSIHDVIAGHYRRYERQELFEKLVDAGYSNIIIVSYGFPFTNVASIGRIALARLQYEEKAKWDQKKQSQQSAFFVRRNTYTNLIGLVLNKYTIYPLSVVAAFFNNFDLGEGYVVSAVKV